MAVYGSANTRTNVAPLELSMAPIMKSTGTTITHLADSKSDEFALLEASRRGSADAFGALARRYEGQVLRVAVRITGSHADAEDVRQLTLLRAFQKLDQFEGRSRFSTWLTRIAVNTSFMYLRTRTTRLTVSLDQTGTGDSELECARDTPDGRSNPEQLCLESEFRTLLNAAIDRLSSNLKIVFLCYAEGLTGRQTAKKLDLTEAAVKSALHRARHILRCTLARKIGISGRSGAAVKTRDCRGYSAPHGYRPRRDQYRDENAAVLGLDCQYVTVAGPRGAEDPGTAGLDGRGRSPAAVGHSD